MYVKYMPEDLHHALIINDSKYPSGYELSRVGFTSEEDAKRGLELYAKTGKWPDPPKEEIDTEKDV